MPGKGCGHLASASELNLGQFGAREGACRGRVCLYPRLATKAGGIPPFDHFPLKKIYSSQNRKNLQVPASAHPGMEDDHVGNRELQTTMVRNKDTRTAAVPIQVDLGRLRAARVAWIEKK